MAVIVIYCTKYVTLRIELCRPIFRKGRASRTAFIWKEKFWAQISRKVNNFFTNLLITLSPQRITFIQIEDYKSCHYCRDDESLLHSFVGCHIVVDFLRKVLCWFIERENSSITLNSKEILFGTATDNDNEIKKTKFLSPLSQILLSFPGNQPTCM